MEKKPLFKPLAILLILILITNMILFAMKKISGLMFWGIILVIFLLNYAFFKKRNNKK